MVKARAARDKHGDSGHNQMGMNPKLWKNLGHHLKEHGPLPLQMKLHTWNRTVSGCWDWNFFNRDIRCSISPQLSNHDLNIPQCLVGLTSINMGNLEVIGFPKSFVGISRKHRLVLGPRICGVFTVLEVISTTLDPEKTWEPDLNAIDFCESCY